MRKDLVDITLIVDRSGSMAQVQEEAEGGINAFIKEQAGVEGDAVLSIVQFDTQYEFVVNGKPIESVDPYHLVPRGMTALLDAMGRAINETGERLAAMDEAERPGLVMMVVMTDGLENSSCEFTKSQIAKMVKHQQQRYNWQFTFLGANQDAFAEAQALGIDQSGVANYSSRKSYVMGQSLSSKTRRMRDAMRLDKVVSNEFSAAEKENMS